jgi:hypothetical protein
VNKSPCSSRAMDSGEARPSLPGIHLQIGPLQCYVQPCHGTICAEIETSRQSVQSVHWQSVQSCEQSNTQILCTILTSILIAQFLSIFVQDLFKSAILYVLYNVVQPQFQKQYTDRSVLRKLLVNVFVWIDQELVNVFAWIDQDHKW